MFSVNEINEKKFEKAAFGYKPESVDTFLFEVSEAYSAVVEENKQLQKKIQILAEKVQEYREQEDSLRDTLLTAQRLGDSLLKESKNKADVIIKDASAKAEKIVESAQKKLEGEQIALTKMQREVSGFKTRLMSLYKTHIELISALPDYEEPAEKPQETPAEQPEPAAEPVTETVVEVVEEADAPETEEKSNALGFTPKAMPESDEPETPKSKFGPLQFGEDYEVKRNGKYSRK
ncbi:MAG TPA: hypothetical protein DCE08_03455 [Ruminococcaceae bacterium]|nr:hypothetical protein [Oscillospiraceae bacterium]